MSFKNWKERYRAKINSNSDDQIDWHHNQKWVRRWVQVASIALAVLLVINFLKEEWIIFYVNLCRAFAMFVVYRLLFRSRKFPFWQLPVLLILIVFNVVNTYVALHYSASVKYMILSNLVFGILLFRRSLPALFTAISSLACFSMVEYHQQLMPDYDVSPGRKVMNIIIWLLMIMAVLYEFAKQWHNSWLNKAAENAQRVSQLTARLDRLQRQNRKLASMQNDAAESFLRGQKAARDLKAIADGFGQDASQRQQLLLKQVSNDLTETRYGLLHMIQQCQVHYPEFLEWCTGLSPALTEGNRQLLILHRLNIPSSDICALLNITEAGLQKARSRLKHRYHWEKELNLYQITANSRIISSQ